ncbi:hypothetical protein JCM10207_006912 [Rhodosporidiobolus poonsookiae]
MASPLPSLPSTPSPTLSGAPPAPPGPPKLVNLYYLRTVATPKSCFICHRDTTTCLATQDVSDFVYVCKSHLLDPGFAKPAASQPSSSAPSSPSPASSPAPSPSVPQSEIDKVKKEYEEKQARRAASSSSDSKDSEGEKAKGPASTAFSLLRTGASTLTSLSTSAASTLFPPPPPVAPSATDLARAAAEKAKVFVLQREYFAMRVAQKRREWERRDAKERGGGWSFPKAPTGRIG